MTNQTQNRRLLMALDAKIKEVNRAIINPVLPELRLSDLTPMLEMTARARADYLRAVYEIGRASTDNAVPSPENIKRLAGLRLVYQELVSATQAFETAIEREYLDVE
ncbi:hypothetical protein ThidrDRAFT_1199 [Thiorhodococcus drewsii AZ1]|uniref:Uncharacterized protein n=1 Tax=Thiorhodococcus drewsii AZ1 TaxID=765913 RepID=G2DYT7_9GAMM|nr:hypothetical protein [Thiorhodococcus drewsii]EGV32714.1 hypothetical protein ThidrDRAFT_1199 [Thiorhodococcus drewsii AZ1]